MTLPVQADPSIEVDTGKRAARPSDATLQVRGVSKRFPRAPLPVLDRVDLSLAPGDAVLIGGRNGAGKTTLLRMLSGLLAPDEGAVELNGLSPERNRRAYQSRIGFLSAGTSGLYARLTVRQHLAYWSRLAFIPRPNRHAIIEASLDDFDLRGLAARRVDRMSMGQRQRVRIAMTFLHAPALVLLDEPASSLDTEGTALLRRAAIRTVAGGGALVCCSPQDDTAGIRFDRVYHVRDGHLVPM